MEWQSWLWRDARQIPQCYRVFIPLRFRVKPDSSQTQRSQRFVWVTLVRQPSSSRRFANTINLLGLCVSSLAGLDCGLTTGMTAGGLVQRYNLLRNDTTTTTTTTSIELEQLFSLALSLQRIIPPLLSVGCALFFIGILSLAELKRRMWRSQLQEAQKMRSLPIEYTLAMMWGSAAFGLVSAASVDLTATGLQFVTSTLANSSISVTAGIALVVLQWLAFSFSAIFVLGIYSILRREGGTSSKSAGGGSAEIPPPPPPPPRPRGPPGFF